MVTGVETAGLVLAAIPLLVLFLDKYRAGMRRTSVFFKRKKHVERLTRALLDQRVLLDANVRTLLLRVEIDCIPEESGELFEFLIDNTEARERIKDFLGEEAYSSYVEGVSSSEQVVSRLIMSFKVLSSSPSTSNGDILSFIEAFKSTTPSQLAIIERTKLTLDYQGLESSISDLDHSTTILERIHQAAKQRHEVVVDSSDRKAAKLASSLQIVREHAISLFNALARSWNTGCHQNHEAKIYLDGTKIVHSQQYNKQTYSKKQKPHIFSLILSSNDQNPYKFWYENTIEVLDNDSISHNSSAVTALRSSRPQVTIAPPAIKSSGGTISFIDVQNLCTTIDWATRERKMLKFYLASQQRIRCQHEDCVRLLSHAHHSSVSLEELLVTLPKVASPAKIGLRNRMLLALNLASTLLELQNTPWLTDSWSKRAIKFLKRPVPLSSPSAVAGNTILTAVVDYQHPFISKCFQSEPQPSGNAAHPLPPKEALLELGIMLLELWHETTFENFYTTTAMGQSGEPMPADYWGRLRAASMWLEDAHDPPLPLYHAAISQCVKCFFGGTFSTPSWNDSKFFKALCKDLIAPLFQSCKQWL